MVISTKGRYALRLMIDLAQHCDEQRRSTARALSSVSAARRAAIA